MRLADETKGEEGVVLGLHYQQGGGPSFLLCFTLCHPSGTDGEAGGRECWRGSESDGIIKDINIRQALHSSL